MRYLLAFVLLLFSLPVGAEEPEAEWEKVTKDYDHAFYVDRETIREQSGHRLVWMKYVMNGSIPGYYDLRLAEFDCMGRWISLRSYVVNQGVRKDSAFGGNPAKEWDIIIPGSGFRAVEKAVCGK